MKEYNTEWFVQKARKKHGDKYDYSLVEYVKSESKVTIICPKHGKFQQTPHNHYNFGCNTCGIEQSSNKLKSNTEDFINKAKIIHGDLFNYSLVDYKHSKVKVKIACQNGHIFAISPNEHLRGWGCSRCKRSSLEMNMESILKKNNIKFTHQKRFKTCYNPETNYALIFDFYLPEHKTLIEINGPSHYIKNFYKTSGDNFSNRVKRDLIKRRWAQKNGYNFLVVPYTKTKYMQQMLLKVID